MKEKKGEWKGETKSKPQEEISEIRRQTKMGELHELSEEEYDNTDLDVSAVIKKHISSELKQIYVVGMFLDRELVLEKETPDLPSAEKLIEEYVALLNSAITEGSPEKYYTIKYSEEQAEAIREIGIEEVEGEYF